MFLLGIKFVMGPLRAGAWVWTQCESWCTKLIATIARALLLATCLLHNAMKMCCVNFLETNMVLNSMKCLIDNQIM